MAIWKNASAVFLGGTEQIRALQGRRVRAKVNLQGAHVHDPASVRPQTLDVAQGAIGLVALPHPTRFDFLIAFPTDQSKPPSTLNALKAGSFKVVEINEATFKQQFEVEVP